MLKSFIVRLVAWSVRRPLRVIFLSLVLAILSGFYVAGHFKINTDISRLVENDQAWTSLDDAIDNAFPQRGQTVLVVVEAQAPEFADAAANALTAALKKQPKEFVAVTQPAGGPFFEHNGLLFPSLDEVQSTTGQLVQSRPLVNALAKDPSLTGLAGVLNTSLLLPLQLGQVKLSDMSRLLSQSATVLDRVLAGQPAAFSWRALVDKDVSTNPARAFITVQPVVDYGALEPGARASAAIRATAASLDLGAHYGASIRLTGEQPLADEEFASVQDGAALNGIITFIVVLVILWLALRSGRIIVAVFITLFVGLAITAALGLMMVGALNMISVAFMVLFVGLGIDFGVQFGVKYREERYRDDRLGAALVNTAHTIGVPLTLAAVAVAEAFFSFLPTAYRGVAELGQIAGVGMFVAYLTNMTLFPALLKIFNPPGEAGSPGFTQLAPVDDFLDRNRKPVLIGTLVVVLGALPLLTHLRFDFNPLHLKDPHTESMATLLSLKDSPEAAVNNVHVLAPSLAAADQIAARLKKLPEVGRVTTLSTFIPDDQTQKLLLINSAAQQLLPALTQTPAAPSSDALRVAALKRVANPVGARRRGSSGSGRGRSAAPVGDAAKARRRQCRHARPRGNGHVRHLEDRTAATHRAAAAQRNHPRHLAARNLARLGRGRRPRAGRYRAQGPARRRPRRRYDAAPLRTRGEGHGTGCDRRHDFDPAFSRRHHQGVPASGRLGTADHHHPLVAGAAAHRRRDAHADSAAGISVGDTGTVCCVRHAT